MKKLLAACIMTISLSSSMAFAGCGCDIPKPTADCNKPTCEECAERVKSMSDCRDKKREEIYCRLKLDSCQRDKAMEIESKYDADLDCIGDKIKADHKSLCKQLHESCLDKSAVIDKENILKEDFKDLKSKIKCMDKEFNNILNKEQKSEYRKVKSELKFKMKHSKKFCCHPCCNHK